jgi:hypothetical protein
MIDKKKRRIFIATPFENKMAQRGTRLPMLAEYLVSKGYEVEFLTTNFSHAYKIHFDEKEIEECQKKITYKMSILAIPGYKKNISIGRVFANILLGQKYFAYFLKSAMRKDIIIIPSRPVELIFCVALLKVIRRTKVILDISDIWPDALVISNKFKKLIFTVYCNLLLCVSIKKFDRYIHTAPSFLLWLRRYAPKAKSIFIPLGFDAKRWSSIPREKKFCHNGLSIIFVGLLQFQLDVMPVLKSLVSRENIKLTLIGDSGTGARYQEVQEFILQNNMKNVHIVGRVEPDKVPDYMCKHDIGLIPMITSSMTNKLFDYIASYTPILSLGDNDTSAFVRKYNIGWSAPFDGEKIGELLDSIDREQLQNRSNNIQKIRNQFSRDILFAKFLDVIESI